MPQIDIQQILIRILVLTLSLSIHEYAHAKTAYRLGDDTAASQGRLTLNPAAHIDLMGALAFVLVGFGWAKPVPVNPARFSHEKVKNMRSGMMKVALAGPISNLIIAFIANVIYQILLLIIRLTHNVATLSQPVVAILILILNTFIYSNIFLAIFNMFPIPPLDGSKVLGVLLPDKAYYRYMRFQRYSGIIMLLLIFVGGGIIGKVVQIIAIPINYIILYPVNLLFSIF